MTPPVLAALFTALAVLGLLLAEQRASSLGKWLTKPAASCGFLAVAWLAGALEHAFGQRMLLGLALCALGDVLLIPPGNGPTFLAGIGSFAHGHAVYAWAFAARELHLLAAVSGLAGMLIVVFAVLRWLGPHLPADMRVPVRVYMAVIACMVATAAGTQDPWIIVGALAFALSDVSVARDRFVQPQLLNVLWGLPLYYFAQLVLASSSAR